jgi:hypothetical protein
MWRGWILESNLLVEVTAEIIFKTEEEVALMVVIEEDTKAETMMEETDLPAEISEIDLVDALIVVKKVT